MKKIKLILLLIFALALAGCKSADCTHIAVLGSAADDQQLKVEFPESKIIRFKSPSEFLLALATGKCDVGVIDREEGEEIIGQNADYVSLSDAERTDTQTIVIAHTSSITGVRYIDEDRDFLDNSIERINRSIISDGYWKLILRGLAATVSIFLLGITMAFALAILMQWMNRHRYLKYVSGPVSLFIRTIHDVPSIVLIFFFYYIVFAYTQVNGIIVCAISLGVYTSGSLMNIFNVHLNQIDRNQHAAAEMLGLKGWKKYRYVILPQAVKPMLPLLGAESKVLLRATTYAGYISELDLVKVTEIIRNQTYDVLVPLLLVSVIFLVLSNIIIESLSAIYNKVFKYD